MLTFRPIVTPTAPLLPMLKMRTHGTYIRVTSGLGHKCPSQSSCQGLVACLPVVLQEGVVFRKWGLWREVSHRERNILHRVRPVPTFFLSLTLATTKSTALLRHHVLIAIDLALSAFPPFLPALSAPSHHLSPRLRNTVANAAILLLRAFPTEMYKQNASKPQKLFP